MKYKNFEDLPVWNAAIEFALGLFELTQAADFRGIGDVKSQIERAAVSISNNIAEGFERGTNNDLINFLYISKGSAGECRSMLRICERSAKFSNFRSEISNLISREENISKQLNGWIESLKNSDIKGIRYLNDRDRARMREMNDREEFDREIRSRVEKAAEQRDERRRRRSDIL
ncbi:MAG: four helix bundle protein [Acidobacteria bacterium]|nr:four helix bundle protein [Acidobacteriota bacterium]